MQYSEWFLLAQRIIKTRVVQENNMFMHPAFYCVMPSIVGEGSQIPLGELISYVTLETS